MEQPTIFGEQFEQDFRIRRRSLLSVGLKVYIWLGMISSCILFFTMLGLTLFWNSRLYGFSLNYLQMAGAILLAGLFTGIMLSLTASLWFEFKWAIRYNWIMGGIWLVLMIINACMGTLQLSQINGAALTIPYWIMLFRIQRRWEQVAVAKRELRA